MNKYIKCEGVSDDCCKQFVNTEEKVGRSEMNQKE